MQRPRDAHENFDQQALLLRRDLMLEASWMRLWLRRLGVVAGVLLLLFCAFVLLVRNEVIGPPKVSAEAIETSVTHQAALMDKAFALPAASKYGRDTHFQTHGSFCGPASLVNVFRSLGDAVSHESAVLDGTGRCSLGFCWMGLTLDELAGVARHGGHPVEVLRELTPETFRQHMRRSNDPSVRYIVNFTRKKIFGGGGGHHSPVGGYLEDEDLVLVLDVNEAFRPWLIECERLFAAVDTLDGDAKRGLLLIR